MYSVSQYHNDKYGNVIEISIDKNGIYETPFKAIAQVKLIRRLWSENHNDKIRILINKQVLTIKEMEKWCLEEYKLLPKCKNCAICLKERIYTHPLSKTSIFCSQKCADVDYNYEIEKMKDEEEIDYL